MTRDEAKGPGRAKERLALLLLDGERTRGRDELCREAGISDKALGRALADEGFCRYLRAELERRTDAAAPLVWRALVNKAAAGDVPAMKLFFEMKNLYKVKAESVPAGQTSLRWEEG